MIKKYLKKFIICFENVRSKYKRQKEILIIVHNELMFEYAILYFKLLSSNKLIKIHLTFPYQNVLIKKNIILSKKKQYNFHLIGIRLASYIKWDLILFPNHYDCTWFYFKNFKKVYCGHGLFTGNVKNGELYTFDYKYTMNINNTLYYDYIFVDSLFEKEIATKKYPLLENSLKVTGSLMYDTIYKQKKQYSNKRKTILITSTWGNTSLIQTQINNIYSILKNLLEKYDIKISIHPNNYKNTSINDKLLELKNLQNLELTNIPCKAHEFISQADILITDHTSLGLYFLSTNNPIILFKTNEVQLHQESPFTALSKIALQIDNFDNINQDILYSFNNYKMNCYQTVIDTYINNIGKSEYFIKDIIYSLLNIYA